MTHKHEEYLKALADGRIVEYKYAQASDVEHSWFNVIGHTSDDANGIRLYNTTAMAFLLSGEQLLGFEIDLRIKDEA